MIQTFVDRFIENKSSIRLKFTENHPESYLDIVKVVIEAVTDDKYTKYSPDPERIHQINDGDYQGTLVYVIGEKGSQPDAYYYVRVAYGSCSGCDTLEGIREYDDDPPSEKQVNAYMALALNVVQQLKKMDEEVVLGVPDES